MEKTQSLDYFNTVSADWDQMANSFFGDAPRNSILEMLGDTVVSKVADLGCGTGYLTKAFVNRARKIYAIDQSQEMLSQMAQRFSNYTNIEYLPGFSEMLPLEDESVDLVIANMYLHHVEKPDRAISEMARILKAGGLLMFTDLDHHHYQFLLQEQHDRWPGFDREQIHSWLEDAGLESIHLDCVGSNCCASSCCGDSNATISIFIASAQKPINK